MSKIAGYTLLSDSSWYQRHRATNYNEQQREMRLEQTLQPIMSQWRKENLSRSLSSFDGFCELVGLGGIQNYIGVRSLHRIENWSAHQLDEEGRLHQIHMHKCIEVSSDSLLVDADY